MMQPERYLQARKITIIGAGVNALLGVIKLFGGILFHSHALIADGVHSFADLITDAMVIFASKYGSQDADESHPYGHQRIETAATMLLALLLILAGAGIFWDALDELLYHTDVTPNVLALIIALGSILANESLYHYTHRVGTRIQSALIIANAWHHRSDAASSAVVLIGLLGSLLGFLFLDSIAAMIVGFMIIKMGWDYGWNSIKELVDTAVDGQTITRIETIIGKVDGVQKIHQLRSRSMGKDVLVDVHILVHPWISVSEGHFIAQKVHFALVQKIESVKDVTVHVDPEDDEIVCPSLHLPARGVLENRYLLKWRTDFPGILSWVLHYLEGKLFIDVICAENFKLEQVLENRIKTDLSKQTEIHDVRILYEKKYLPKTMCRNNMQLHYSKRQDCI